MFDSMNYFDKRDLSFFNKRGQLMWLVFTVLAMFLSFSPTVYANDNKQPNNTDSVTMINNLQEDLGDEILDDFVAYHYNFSYIANMYQLLNLESNSFDTRNMLKILENLHTYVSNIQINLTVEDLVKYLKSQKVLSFWAGRTLLKKTNTDEANGVFKEKIRSIVERNIKEKLVYHIKNNIEYLGSKAKRQTSRDLSMFEDTSFIQSVLKSSSIPVIIKSSLITVIAQIYFEDFTNKIRGYDLFSNTEFIKHLLISSDVPTPIKDGIVQRMRKADYDITSILNDIRRIDPRSNFLADFFYDSTNKNTLLNDLLRQKIQTQNLSNIVLTPLGWENILKDPYALELTVSLFNASTRQIQRYIGKDNSPSIPVKSQLYLTSFYSNFIKEISEDLCSELLYVLGFVPSPNKQEITNSRSINLWNSSFVRSLQSVIKERISISFHKDLVKKITEAFNQAKSTNNWNSIDELLKNSSFASLLYNSRFIPNDVKMMIYDRTSRLFSSSADYNKSFECTSVFTISGKEDKDI